MKEFISAAVFMIIIAFCAGCSDEKNPEPSGILSPENTEETNSPPETPVIITPENNAVNTDTSVEISWFTNDPDGDNLIYVIYFWKIADGNMFLNGNFNTVKTSIILDSLDYAASYAFTAGASDGKDTVFSDTVRFITAGRQICFPK